MLNILKSPESCIKPMRSAYFSATHWSTFQQTRNHTRLKEIKKYTSNSFCIFQHVEKSKSETSKLVNWNFLKHHCPLLSPLWNHEMEKSKESEPEKFIHSEKIKSPIKPQYLAWIPKGAIWYKSISPFLLATHFSYQPLSLSELVSPFKQLKSDYSSSHCDRDHHEALQSWLTVHHWLFLAGGQTCQLFRIWAISQVSSRCTSCSM